MLAFFSVQVEGNYNYSKSNLRTNNGEKAETLNKNSVSEEKMIDTLLLKYGNYNP